MRINLLKITLLLSISTIYMTAVAGSMSGWKSTSDLLAIGLPVAAAGAAWANSDTVGLKEFAATLVSTVGVSEILKYSIHKTRPDGSDNRSFPSGHTAVAFAAVGFIDRRWGDSQTYRPWLYGAAALTGLARVKADKHHWQDVMAGAAIGYASARWLTTARDGHTALSAQALGRAGVLVTWHQSW